MSIYRGWKRWARAVEEALRELGLEDAEVRVIGGAAEGRLTPRSDVDVLVILDRELDFEEAVELRMRLWERLEEKGVPFHAPLEVIFKGRKPSTLKGERLYDEARKSGENV